MKKTTLLIIVLSVVTILAISVTIWALFLREPDVILTPDYAPQQTEPHAESLPNDNGGKLEAHEGGGAVSLTYSNQVRIDLSDKCASLLFANPGKSNQDIVIQIFFQNEIIVQSGTITPGHQVTRLDLLSHAENKLAAGGYDGKIVVLYYNQETGEKAIVNTEIPVHITVEQ